MDKKSFFERTVEESLWGQAKNRPKPKGRLAGAIKRTSLAEPSEAHRRVLYYFFSYPEQAIGLNDLAKSIRTSKTSTREAVLRLEREGFLKKEVIGNAWRICANLKHPYTTTTKIPHNVQLIYECGIINAVYDKVPGARAVILFGSYRWGTDNENSDIDIAAEVLDSKDLRILSLGKVDFEFRKNVTVNLHIFSRNKIDLNLFTNIANGIVLDGVLEVRP